MGTRRGVAGLVLAAGSLVAAARFARARSKPRERVDVYLADGSTISFEPSSPEGARLLPLARRALAAARG